MLNTEIPGGDTGRAFVTTRKSANLGTPAPSLSSLARAALIDAENDTEQAAFILAAQLSDPAIRRALSLDAVRVAAASAIGSVRARERVAIEAGAQVSKVLTQAGAVDRSYMAFPLPFGGVLGDATVDELNRAADHYAKAGNTMTRRAAWLTRIAQATPPGSRVRDAVTEAQLAEWSVS